jgi:hypothetical protein
LALWEYHIGMCAQLAHFSCHTDSLYSLQLSESEKTSEMACDMHFQSANRLIAILESNSQTI